MKIKNQKLRNLDAIIIVAVILVVLGCKCNSDFVKKLQGEDSGGNTESNTALNSSNSSNSSSNKDANVFDSKNSNDSDPDKPPFPDSNKSDGNTTGSGDVLDRLPLSVGSSKRTKGDKSDPQKEGFGNADDMALGEYSVDGKTVQFAVASYSSAADAEKMLKKQMDDLKKQNAKISEIGTAVNNSGQEIGISGEAEGNGNLVVLWTNKNFLHIAYGPKSATRKFFADYDVP